MLNCPFTREESDPDTLCLPTYLINPLLINNLQSSVSVKKSVKLPMERER